MAIRVGINGFGRIGRMVLRTAWQWPAGTGLEFVHINDLSGDPACAAHLLMHDSTHGRWSRPVESTPTQIVVDGQAIGYSMARTPQEVDWQQKGVEVLVECSGQFKSRQALQPYLDQGIKKVVVSSPMADPTVLHVVMGVNDHLYDPTRHAIVTAASCTTNCLAPVVQVILQKLGIRRASLTTIHSMNNTQGIVDQYRPDLRRARAANLSMIPTSTSAAQAIVHIFPELAGKIDGLAVRVPVLTASLTDMVFEVQRTTCVAEVNQWLQEAADGPLRGILGYETAPLVSVDYNNDSRSAIVDALATKVIDGTHVKVLAWYDNETGYTNRLVELLHAVAHSLRA
ncbi:MAG: ArsJ-associated glyceraldehyde-3-phosphate dehydrogenase [Magnetococcales bacterium]|nr:ArsJ-associated glyceraldehyde-3-phosphate dehydrogenase [Magnetococcales bacterium]